MKRTWLLALLMAGSLVALNSPAFAKGEDAPSDSQDTLEDVNSALGSLASRVSDLEHKGGPTVEIHGFVQSDYISDSTQSFNETVGDGKVAAQGVTSGPADNGFSQFSLRNSRIDFLAKQKVDNWAFKGYMEYDFLGANNTANEYKFYTQPTLRMRHGYVQADSDDGWMLMAGQWWSLFGWNMDYVLNTVAEPPVMGTLYERIPQLRVQKTFGDPNGMQLQIDVAAEKPDQDISQVPTQLAGLRFIVNDIKGHYCSSTGGESLKPFSLGISGRNAFYVWGNGANGSDALNNGIWASAAAADVLIPVLPANNADDPSIVITGEGTYGAGDTLPFNGGGFGGISAINGNAGGGLPSAIAAPYTSTDDGAVAKVNGGLTPIQLQSYNGQVQIFLPRKIGTILTCGYGEIYAINVAELGGSGVVSYNDDSNWFVNAMQDVTGNVRVALEYDQFITHYTNGTQGADNRLQLSTWYRF